MKKIKILLSFLLIALSLSACSGQPKEQEKATMTTQASKVKFYIIGESVTINWGDGNSDFYKLLSNDLTHSYSDNSYAHNITIKGENIIMFVSNSNKLTSLDVSGLTATTTLSCMDNQLTDLNLRGLTSVEFLACNNNYLSVLDVSGLTRLEELYCHTNRLTTINLSGLTKLKKLVCNNNWRLTSINVRGLTALNRLDHDPSCHIIK